MKLHRLLLSLSFATSVAFGMCNSAQAGTLLSFGQVSTSNTIAATNVDAIGNVNLNDTQIKGVDVHVSSGLFADAYLNFTFNSVGPASTLFGTTFAQQYAATFTLTSGAGGTGTNYLTAATPFGVVVSGSLANATDFAVVSTSIPVPPVFTSGVFVGLTGPFGLGFSFGNVKDPLGNPLATSLNANVTLNPFQSSVSGNFSGTAVPEPSSMALLGLGGLGWAIRAIRRRRTTSV